MAISDATKRQIDRQIHVGTDQPLGAAVQTAEQNVAQLMSDMSNQKDLVYGVATHDYGATATAWTLSASEALKRVLIVTNASGAADIVAPATAGIGYIVRNTSGQAITIKKAGQTGITIASAKNAQVVGIGTDFVRVSADA